MIYYAQLSRFRVIILCHIDPNAVMPTLGADNGLSLIDMRGLAYDDPKWDKLLDQLTFDDMVSLIGDLCVFAPGP